MWRHYIRGPGVFIERCIGIIARWYVFLLYISMHTNKKHFEKHIDSPYPWAFLICGLSFILLFFLERILVHQLLHHHHHHGHTQELEQQHVDVVENDCDHHHEDHHHHHEHKGLKLHSHSNSDEHKHEHSSLIHPHHDHHHGVIKEHAQDMLSLINQKNYFSAIVLLFGLGIHSILSGLAVGASNQHSETISLGIAILSHKYLASFALGCPLYKAAKTLRFTVCIALIFASLTPIGIVIGLLLQSAIDSNPWIADVFICIAAGTFLYISICEIMIPEFSEEKALEIKLYASVEAMKAKQSKECVEEECVSKECEPKQNDRDDMKKMCCVLFGFGLMSMLAKWI